jgi:hypothetical protein
MSAAVAVRRCRASGLRRPQASECAITITVACTGRAVVSAVAAALVLPVMPLRAAPGNAAASKASYCISPMKITGF